MEGGPHPISQLSGENRGPRGGVTLPLALAIVAMGVSWKYREPMTRWAMRPGSRQALLTLGYPYFFAWVAGSEGAP